MNRQYEKYTLIKRQLEMDPEFVTEEQKQFLIEMDNLLNDSEKDKLDKITSAKSSLEMRCIERNIPEEFLKTNQSIQVDEEPGRQFVKKAGFADALIMALVTGFVGGIATTILFIMMNK